MQVPNVPNMPNMPTNINYPMSQDQSSVLTGQPNNNQLLKESIASSYIIDKLKD